MNICNICSNKELILLKQISKSQIYECPRCKLGITVGGPLMSKKISEIRSLYNFRLYDSFRKDYENRFNQLITIIKRYKTHGSILEIGAGFGLFSSLLSKDGKFKINVIEPYLSTDYLKGKKHVVVYNCPLESFLIKNRNKYDLIVLLDVLEHLLDPYNIMGQLKTRLKTNGLIVIQLPNYRSFMAKLCLKWGWWMIEDHKYHFSVDAIKTLLMKNKFKIKYIRTYEYFNDFKKNLDGNFEGIENVLVRKIIKGLFLIIFVPFYFTFRKFIWVLGYGGLIFLIAESK